MVALGFGEFLGGVVDGAPSLVESVGDSVIDRMPEALVDFGITAFGTADKAVFLVTMLAICAALAALLGRLSVRHPALAATGFAAFGAVGLAAGLEDPQATTGATVVTASLATAAGIGVLLFLTGMAKPEPATDTALSPVPMRFADRRAFLSAAAVLATGAAAGAVVGRRAARTATNRARTRYALPAAAVPAAPPPAAAELGVDGLARYVVPNGDFYRIDTRLLGAPSVDADRWRLQIKGMVDRPFELSLADLLAMPLVEEYVTLSCVSNEVGGDLVGNAKWTGVPLTTLLERAGVQPGAGQIVGRAVDGFTVGFPTDVALDGRKALVAVGMNDELLPTLHGFPARLVVAGLYGYTSATKWLAEIELTRWEDFDAYWVPRGWDKYAEVLTQSRIDTVVPTPLVAGPLTVAGVAWAPERGISRVEIRVDDGAWVDAELADTVSGNTWRQWRYRWEATEGSHRLTVRATDTDGEVQTARERNPGPNGATGYHSVQVKVREP
jgi:DMSO/TMAO reductase YedYZ molybdopterin-dependent catalytic subunit